MRRTTTSLSRRSLTVAALLLGAASILEGQAAKASKAEFTLTVPDLVSHDESSLGYGRFGIMHVFNGKGCNGQNISPRILWANPPEGTKSFAVFMLEEDALPGEAWRWVMYNIPAATTGLPAGAGNRNAPRGSVQGWTDFIGYRGPCPPVGDKPHRYIIQVFALKTEKLDFPGWATPGYVVLNLHQNKLAQPARVTGLYGR